MKKIILAAIALTTFTATFAQKEIKYAKLFYRDMSIENGDVTYTVDNAVSTDGETKFKLTINNKTNDFILYKPEESKFIIDGKEIKPTEKWKIIEPNSSNWVTVNIKGTGYNAIKSYSFVLDGLYKISTSAKSIATPDFKLPLAKNDFTTGSFNLKVNKLYKESDATNLKMDVSYNGDKIGIIFPEKAGVVMPDGKEYAAVKPTGLLKKGGPILFIKKGTSDSFSVNWERMDGGKTMDMQKADMTVKWNDAFVEVAPVKMKVETLNLEFDEVASNAKGK